MLKGLIDVAASLPMGKGDGPLAEALGTSGWAVERPFTCGVRLIGDSSPLTALSRKVGGQCRLEDAESFGSVGEGVRTAGSGAGNCSGDGVARLFVVKFRGSLLVSSEASFRVEWEGGGEGIWGEGNGGVVEGFGENRGWEQDVASFFDECDSEP